MIIFFNKSKTNQEGLDTNLPWHIHTNPMLPGCFPIRAMGVYLFTSPNIINKNSRLFPGEQQYWRYCYILKRLIEDNKEDLDNYGSVENLGSHCIQKGVASYCSSDSTVSSSIVSICFRAVWAVSGAKKCYLKYENYCDQFVSRLVCSLNPSSP